MHQSGGDNYSNEELAVMIKNGKKEYEGQLWGQVKPTVILLAGRYRELIDRYSYVDIEDFIQCGYFAMVDTIAEFKPERGYKFTSFLKFNYSRHVGVMLGAKSRRVDGKPKRVFPESYASLNQEVDADKDKTEFIDMLEDEASAKAFEDIEGQELARIMDEAICELENRQQKVVRGLYFYEETTDDLVKKLNLQDMKQVYKIKEAAFCRLSRSRFLREYYYAHFSVPKPVRSIKTRPENVVIANEYREDWLAQMKKEMEDFKNGL